MAAATPEIVERAQSPRETRLRLLLTRAGYDLESDVEVQLPRCPLYRVDLALRGRKIAFEYQGEHHADLEQYRADQTRLSRLRAHGWLVMEINARDLDDPVELLARIARAIAAHPH
ncbi:hypothetical protein [Schumannella soli]|uniref:DUF559 domain-containing protein n=1 Tax=Schumannella soli TaxID=2590779 RepID=A0A506XY72_9MICO|nr:hypothetical protein [Schumannella soli]TPW74652.1 hypothetical protein FJ657_13790 [Schumannella soli]